MEPLSLEAIKDFFVSDRHWNDVLGFHVSIVIAVCIGVYIGQLRAAKKELERLRRRK